PRSNTRQPNISNMENYGTTQVEYKIIQETKGQAVHINMYIKVSDRYVFADTCLVFTTQDKNHEEAMQECIKKAEKQFNIKIKTGGIIA
ncbi:hypothetical protein ACFSTE_09490, partial [Aquimarina hainanensis]